VGGYKFDQSKSPKARRQNPRIKPNQPVPILLPDNTQRDDLIQDISLGGICIQCDRATAMTIHPRGGRIDPDNAPMVELHIEFPTAGTRQMVPIKCKLRYLRGNPNGMFDFGMQFMDLNKDAQKQLKKFVRESLMPA
jgi:c-di-GMP-binding flagellar brake protein YcgR